jgi:hypothetical protein
MLAFGGGGGSTRVAPCRRASESPHAAPTPSQPTPHPAPTAARRRAYASAGYVDGNAPRMLDAVASYVVQRVRKQHINAVRCALTLFDRKCFREAEPGSGRL